MPISSLPSQLQAILFDSDGVLADTERVFFEATRAAFGRAGVTLEDARWARWYLAEGRRSREVARLLGIAPSVVEELIEFRDGCFWSRVDAGGLVFPGVRETLAGLAGRFRLAVVTGASRDHFDRVHASTGLAGFFETIIAREDYEQPKPHADAYLAALERLGLEPGRCLAVEDSPRGAAAAVAAGIRCCVVPTALTDAALCPGGCLTLSRVADLAALTKFNIP